MTVEEQEVCILGHDGPCTTAAHTAASIRIYANQLWRSERHYAKAVAHLPREGRDHVRRLVVQLLRAEHMSSSDVPAHVRRLLAGRP